MIVMLLSGITGYYVMYFLFTALFYIVLRRKLHSVPFLLFLFGGAILLGALAPLMSMLLGGWMSVLLLLGGAVALSILFMYKSRQLDEYEEVSYQEEEEKEEPSLPSPHKETQHFTSKEEKADTEQEASNQENIDLLLAELLAKQEPATGEQAIGEQATKLELDTEKEEDGRLTLDDFLKEEPASAFEASHLEEQEDKVPMDKENVLEFEPDEFMLETVEEDKEKTEEKAGEREDVTLPAPNDSLLSDEEELPVYTFENEEDQSVYSTTDEEIFPLEDEARELSDTAEKDTELYHSNLEDVIEEEMGDHLRPVAEETHESNDFILEESKEENESTESYKEDAFLSDVKMDAEADVQEEQLLTEEEEELSEELEMIAKTLEREEIEKVQAYVVAASTAIESGNYEEAMMRCREALSYPIPFPARLMITEEYVHVLNEMGLYRHSIDELTKLLPYMDGMSEADKERYKTKIIRQIKYIESMTDVLRVEGKPNLPWSLIPLSIQEKAEQKFNALLDSESI
ncbi:hypothetical protein JQN58_05950 [Aneurinibacillus sp. BA2021]|nr:hypothetical protein [Aneurinibacillus sp. BA2021]